MQILDRSKHHITILLCNKFIKTHVQFLKILFLTKHKNMYSFRYIKFDALDKKM